MWSDTTLPDKICNMDKQLTNEEVHAAINKKMNEPAVKPEKSNPWANVPVTPRFILKRVDGKEVTYKNKVGEEVPVMELNPRLRMGGVASKYIPSKYANTSSRNPFSRRNKIPQDIVTPTLEKVGTDPRTGKDVTKQIGTHIRRIFHVKK